VFLGRDIMEERNYSEEVASQIDAEVRAIIDSCYANAFHLLETNIDKLHRLAEALLEKETVEGDEIDRLLSDSPRPSEAKPAAPESAVPDSAAAATAKPSSEKPRSAPKGLPFPPPEPA
ncbi:MAG: cell division protein FtsH, partial [Candidatus Eremiobacterales bacterium]